PGAPSFAAGDAHPDLLAQQAAGADQADARRRQVARQQGERPPVLGPHLHRADELEPLLAAALHPAVGGPLLPDDLPDRPPDVALLRLLLQHAGPGRRPVVVAPLAVAQRRPGQGQDVLPEVLGDAGVTEFFADLGRQDVALPAGPAGDQFSDAV